MGERCARLHKSPRVLFAFGGRRPANRVLVAQEFQGAGAPRKARKAVLPSAPVASRTLCKNPNGRALIQKRQVAGHANRWQKIIYQFKCCPPNRYKRLVVAILTDMKPEPFDLQAPFDLEAQRIFALRAGRRGEQAVADLRLHQLSCQIAGDLCARLGDLRRELREGFVRVADLASHPSLPWEVAGRELSVNLPDDISLRVTDADLASLQTIPPPKARDSADKAGDKSQKPTENQGENQKRIG